MFWLKNREHKVKVSEEGLLAIKFLKVKLRVHHNLISDRIMIQLFSPNSVT